MRCRMAQLKICLYNKLKTFEDLYLGNLVGLNTGRMGLCSDVERIYNEWGTHRQFQWLGDYRSLSRVPGDLDEFNKLVKTSFEECDQSVCIQALKKSADRASGGTGQAAKVLDFVSDRATPKLAAILRINHSRRRDRTLFLNALSGCDFLTPHKHTVKPKCVFCGTANVDWEHLLVSCPGRSAANDCLLASLLERLTKTISADCTNRRDKSVAGNCKELLNRLISERNSADIARFLFGVCCTDAAGRQGCLRHLPILSLIIQVTARAIRQTQESWMDKQAAAFQD